MSEDNGGGKKTISWDDCMKVLGKYTREYTQHINAEADVSGCDKAPETAWVSGCADVSGCEVAPGQIVISKLQEAIARPVEYEYAYTCTGSSDGWVVSGMSSIVSDEKKWMAVIVDCKELDGFTRGNYYELTGKQIDFNGKFYYGVINEHGQAKMLESSMIKIVCVN